MQAKRIFYVLLTMFVCLSLPAQAEQKIVADNWDIHYIAFPSTFIKPDVAKSYNLQRSKYKAVINISVLDNQNKMKAQHVALRGTAKNLLGQTKKLTFTRVTEGPATYYLAQLDYHNEEIFNFNIVIQQGNRTETLKFKKKFYVD